MSTIDMDAEIAEQIAQAELRYALENRENRAPRDGEDVVMSGLETTGQPDLNLLVTDSDEGGNEEEEEGEEEEEENENDGNSSSWDSDDDEGEEEWNGMEWSLMEGERKIPIAEVDNLDFGEESIHSPTFDPDFFTKIQSADMVQEMRAELPIFTSDRVLTLGLSKEQAQNCNIFESVILDILDISDVMSQSIRQLLSIHRCMVSTIAKQSLKVVLETCCPHKKSTFKSKILKWMKQLNTNLVAGRDRIQRHTNVIESVLKDLNVSDYQTFFPITYKNILFVAELCMFSLAQILGGFESMRIAKPIYHALSTPAIVEFHNRMMSCFPEWQDIFSYFQSRFDGILDDQKLNPQYIGFPRSFIQYVVDHP